MVRQDRSIATVRPVSLGAALIVLSALVVAWLMLAGQATPDAEASSSQQTTALWSDARLMDGGASPTPIPSCQLYSYTLGEGTPIGGTYDIGNHCDFCGTTITLPFPVTMYGQSFMTATVTSKGLMAFGWAHTAYNVECLPFSNSTYAMAPFWVDQITATNICVECGIFTATVGTAPNRTFVVEWRTLYFGQRNIPPTLNYEIQLQEGQSAFKYVYGLVTSYEDADTSLTIGTQLSRASDIYTRYYCDPTGEAAPPLTGQQLTWVYNSCGTSTVGPTSTAIATATPTGTSTPFTPGPTSTSSGCFDNGSVPVTCTPTPIVTNTPTITPTWCPSQNYHTSADNFPIEPGTSVVPGSNCDDCSVDIPLPFSYSVYDQTYSTVRVYANGIATFENSPTLATSCFPVSNATYTIFAHGDDLLLTGPGHGVYTSVTGIMPSRTFNIEWRGCYYNGGVCGSNVNFSLSLSEGRRSFQLRYGPNPQAVALVGVQRDATSYTQYACGGTISGSVSFVLGDCATPTPDGPSPTNTPTLAPTNTGTYTNTPLPTQTPGNPSATPMPTNIGTFTSTATPTACAIQFTDVPTDHTFYASIMCLACRDIISGYTSGCETGAPCFRPGNNVTRGQIAKIVSNAAGFNNPVSGQTFEDVPVGSTFYDFIERLVSRGVMQGYPCGSPGHSSIPCVPPDNRPYFVPNGNAYRGQLAKIVSNAANYQEPVTGQTFEDVPPGHTFYDFIERLATRGVMSGYACGGLAEPCVPPDDRPYFLPSSNVTRGQTSKIVANTLFPECNP